MTSWGSRACSSYSIWPTWVTLQWPPSGRRMTSSKVQFLRWQQLERAVALLSQPLSSLIAGRRSSQRGSRKGPQCGFILCMCRRRGQPPRPAAPGAAGEQRRGPFWRLVGAGRLPQWVAGGGPKRGQTGPSPGGCCIRCTRGKVRGMHWMPVGMHSSSGRRASS